MHNTISSFLTDEQLKVIDTIVEKIVSEAQSVSGKAKTKQVITENSLLLAETAATFGYINATDELNQ